MSVSEAVRNPGSYVGTKVSLYRALLFDPERFYEEYAGDQGILREVLLVVAIGLVGTVGTFYAVSRVMSPYSTTDADLEYSVEFQLWNEAVSPLLTVIVLWLGLVAALYAISWLYTEAGSLYLLLKYAAWSLVPLVFANAIQTAAYVYTAYGADVDANHSGTLTEDIYQSIWGQVGNEPVVLVATAISVVFVLWVGYIAAHAVAAVRDLSIDEGYRVVALPVVAYVGYVLYGVVTTAM